MVSNGRASPARIKLFARLNHRVKVPVIVEENLQFLRVVQNDLFGETRARLGEIHASAQLIFGNRSACGRG